MTYKKFIKYVTKIVTYQSRNKKFKHLGLKRRATLNMTCRQLAKKANVTPMTVSRWLKKAEKEGLITLVEQRPWKNGYNPMKFYLIKRVFNKLINQFKLKGYKYIQRVIKDARRDLTSNVTLIKFLFHKNKRDKKYCLRFIYDWNKASFFLVVRGIPDVNLAEIDLRFKKYRKQYASPEVVREVFNNLIADLEAS